MDTLALFVFIAPSAKSTGLYLVSCLEAVSECNYFDLQQALLRAQECLKTVDKSEISQEPNLRSVTELPLVKQSIAESHSEWKSGGSAGCGCSLDGTDCSTSNKCCNPSSICHKENDKCSTCHLCVRTGEDCSVTGKCCDDKSTCFDDKKGGKRCLATCGLSAGYSCTISRKCCGNPEASTCEERGKNDDGTAAYVCCKNKGSNCRNTGNCCKGLECKGTNSGGSFCE